MDPAKDRNSFDKGPRSSLELSLTGVRLQSGTLLIGSGSYCTFQGFTIKNSRQGGSIAQWIADLIPVPAAQVRIAAREVFSRKIFNVAELIGCSALLRMRIEIA